MLRETQAQVFRAHRLGRDEARNEVWEEGHLTRKKADLDGDRELKEKPPSHTWS